jgi:hypothetical protein
MARKSAELVQIKARMPEYLRRQVLAAAKKSGRSFSGELNRIIEVGLAGQGPEELTRKATHDAIWQTLEVLVVTAVRALEKAPPEALATVKSAIASLPEKDRSAVEVVMARDPLQTLDDIRKSLDDLHKSLSFKEQQPSKDQTP